MTSPNPLSIFNPTCSYCWKDSKNPIPFYIGRSLHWACCKKHKAELIKDCREIDGMKKIREVPKKVLIKMYAEIYKEISK